TLLQESNRHVDRNQHAERTSRRNAADVPLIDHTVAVGVPRTTVETAAGSGDADEKPLITDRSAAATSSRQYCIGGNPFTFAGNLIESKATDGPDGVGQ